MMEVDVASGNFTAKTLWFDYCQKVCAVYIDFVNFFATHYILKLRSITF